jgi:hypothetical protein
VWKTCEKRLKQVAPEGNQLFNTEYLPPHDLPHAPSHIREEIKRRIKAGTHQGKPMDPFAQKSWHPLGPLPAEDSMAMALIAEANAYESYASNMLTISEQEGELRPPR